MCHSYRCGSGSACPGPVRIRQENDADPTRDPDPQALVNVFLSFARYRLQPQLRRWKRCSCLARSSISRAPATACPWPGPGAPASSSPGRPSGAPVLLPVFRIRNVYPASDFFPSRIRLFSIPDPTFFHPGSDLFPSRIRLVSIPGSDLFPSRIRLVSISVPGSDFFHPGSASNNLTQINGF